MALSLLPPGSLRMLAGTNEQIGRALYCGEAKAAMFKNTYPLTTIPAFCAYTSNSDAVSEVLLVPVADDTDTLDITSWLTLDTADDTTNYWYAYAGDAVVNPSGTISPAGGGTPTFRQWVEGYSSGPFYIQVSAGTGGGATLRFSEWFYFDDIVTGDPTSGCNRILVTWYDTTCAIANLRYDLLTIRNHLYLPAEVGLPLYVYDEDGQEDGDKEVDPVFQKVSKRSRIDFLVPEYLTEALALLPLHGTVEITDQFGYLLTADNIEMSDPEWVNGCMARVSLTFSNQLDYVIKRCC